MAGKEKRPTEAAESELEIIKQGARMIKGVEDVAVIDSFVVDKNEFLKAYKVSRESGTLNKTTPSQALFTSQKWVIK